MDVLHWIVSKRHHGRWICLLNVGQGGKKKKVDQVKVEHKNRSSQIFCSQVSCYAIRTFAGYSRTQLYCTATTHDCFSILAPSMGGKWILQPGNVFFPSHGHSDDIWHRFFLHHFPHANCIFLTEIGMSRFREIAYSDVCGPFMSRFEPWSNVSYNLPLLPTITDSKKIRQYPP